MKSTASAALASVKHKFQSKIIEVGKLKRDMAKQKALFTDAEEARERVVVSLRKELAQANLYSPTESIKLRAQLAESLRQFDKAYVVACNTERALADAQGSAENWKSMAVVLCIVGVVLGGLSHYAYVLNVGV